MSGRIVLPLGRVMATPGVLERVSRNYLAECLARHMRGDWGLCDLDDARANTRALIDGERILSAYPMDPTLPSRGYGENTIWIITEADRSSTTVLLPDEY